MLSLLAFTISDKLVRTLLVLATFFFKIDEFPKNQEILYYRGSVLYTYLRSAKIVYRVLIEFPGTARFQTRKSVYLGNVDIQDYYIGYGYFYKEITF